jgi:hypothetical protein
MRKQLKTNTRCWTTYIYKKLYKNNPPVSFKKSSEIIDEMHNQMIEHLFSKGRPIQLKKSIGYLELNKRKIQNPNRYIPNWKKTREKGKMVKELNHHTSGYIFSIDFQFAGFNAWRLFEFIALRKHKRELAKRIFNRDVQ